jgi:hypothetical protein
MGVLAAERSRARISSSTAQDHGRLWHMTAWRESTCNAPLVPLPPSDTASRDI